MNYPCRKIAYLFLLTAILAVTGIRGYYFAREWIAKWAFAHRSSFTADELIRIAVAQADLTSRNEYLVNEDEFNWRGQMVDVLYREVRSDTLYIYGFLDEAETELSQQAAWLFQRESHSAKLPAPRTKHFHWESTIQSDDPLLVGSPSAWLSTTRTAFSYVTPQFALPDREVPCPPPNS